MNLSGDILQRRQIEQEVEAGDPGKANTNDGIKGDSRIA
jgi:hypothetical protein